MKLTEKIRFFLSRWMSGRHGSDQLGMFTLLTGLAISLLGSITRLSLLSLLGLALYMITLFRMFSRNQGARYRENQRYLELSGRYTVKTKQFVLRIRNRKEYKYFKCPKCKLLLRIKRGCGEKMITCAKCGHRFSQKA